MRYCLLLAEGCVLVWGTNKFGQCARDHSESPGLMQPSAIPQKLFADEPVAQLATGWTHMLALTGVSFFSYLFLITRSLLWLLTSKGVARGKGGGGIPSPETGKNCCRKMMLFPKALFLLTKFPNILNNSLFLLNFHHKFSQNFPTICVFIQTREKLTRLLNFMKNMLK